MLGVDGRERPMITGMNHAVLTPRRRLAMAGLMVEDRWPASAVAEPDGRGQKRRGGPA